MAVRRGRALQALRIAALLGVAVADFSPWERFANETGFFCNHRVLRSTCPDADFRGFVVFFHGFSACSSQIEKLAPRLTRKCLDVLAPTMPGHGERPIPDCNAPNVSCTVTWNGVQGFDLRRLPTNSSAYAKYVASVNAVVKEERDFRARAVNKTAEDLEVSVMGLSFGGALATHAITTSQGLYGRQLLINPSIGGGQEDIDEHIFECHGQVRQGLKQESSCVDGVASDLVQSFGGGPAEKIFSQLVPRHDSVGQVERDFATRLLLMSEYWLGAEKAKSVQGALNRMFDGVQVWGDVCPRIFEVTPPRTGFCAFQTRHVLATSDFSLHALVAALGPMEGTADVLHKYPLTQTIQTERDGMTRNGASYKLLQQLMSKQQVPKASLCMYRFQNGTNRSDASQYWSSENSMPHACLDQADNPGQVMWWEAGLFGRIVGFLTGNETVSGSETWRGGRDECVSAPLSEEAFERRPWLRDALLPEAAPLKKEELEPDELWTGTLLQIDDWAENFGCKDPVTRAQIEGFVDCSIFGPNATEEDLVIV